MAFEWSESLSVGHDDIDEQHRELLGRFRDLLDACRLGKGKEKIGELFDFLDAYVVSHFRAEENLMAEHAYPGRLDHQDQHAWLAAKLAELKRTLQQDGPSFDLVIDANQTMLNWVVEHIRNTDVRFGRYLKSRA